MVGLLIQYHFLHCGTVKVARLSIRLATLIYGFEFWVRAHTPKKERALAVEMFHGHLLFVDFCEIYNRFEFTRVAALIAT